MASDLATRRSDISGTRDDTLFVALNLDLLDFCFRVCCMYNRLTVLFHERTEARGKELRKILNDTRQR